MSKQVTVEEFRDNLGALLAEVEHGESVTVVRNGKSIGTLRRAASTIEPPRERGRFQDVEVGERPRNLKTDPAQIIIDERERERSGKKYGL
jgi:prevent-host-death family protein